MRKNGNTLSNRHYNPQSAKPPIPLDVDEVDSAMERFLRQKYDSRTLQGNNSKAASRQNTGSSSSEEPPPLPPKPGKRFGPPMRAASSTYPLSSQAGLERGTPLTDSTPYDSPRNLSSPKAYADNSSGWSGGTGESFESKMATLKDMGFKDQKKNAKVLKGLGGNLEKSIESLVRLGEGSAPTSRSRTPISPNPEAFPSPRASPAPPSNLATFSTNPFHQPNSASQFSSTPLATVPQGAVINQNQYIPMDSFGGFNNHNPFLPATNSQDQSMLQSMQNLHVTQPLFPNTTGGVPMTSQQGALPYQPVMTPPLPSLPQQQVYSRDYNQDFQKNASNLGLNPYMPQTSFSSGVFVPSQFSNQTQSAPPNSLYHNSTFPVNDPSSQLIARADKSTIMALYNYPHLAPTPAQPPEASVVPPKLASNTAVAALPAIHPSRSVSTPVLSSVGSRNPFTSEPPRVAGSGLGIVSIDSNPKYRHVSQDSIDAAGFGNGRHSPDAFASLSARSGR
jgi:hypothetical protein